MFFLQSLSVLFGLFMIYVVRIHRKKNHFDPFEYGIWLALWFGFVFLSVFPQTVSGITQTLHIARVFDLLVMISLMILVVFTMLNRISVKNMEKKFEQFIRQKALNEKTKSTR